MSTPEQPDAPLGTNPILDMTLTMMNAWVGAFTRLETLLDLVWRGEVKHVDIPLSRVAIKQALRSELEMAVTTGAPSDDLIKKFIGEILK